MSFVSSPDNPQKDSFEVLYKKYYGGVAATVQKFHFFDGAADDLIQEIFVQAWQSLDSLKDPNAFGGWLMTIARNRCLNEIRKQKKTVSIAMTDTPSDENEHQEVVLVADDHMASLHFEHSVVLLQQLIETHQGEPRATIARMFYLDHMTVKDIADALTINQNTVLSHLRRFRLVISKAMIRLMDENGLELSN
ncbi:MAG: RNA polymerase sigma factor [Oligoflexus sp.]